MKRIFLYCVISDNSSSNLFEFMNKELTKSGDVHANNCNIINIFE